jgi:hypothetical protein
MFDHQMFHERRLTVRLDHKDAVLQNMDLPSGLEGVGKGLGANGTPLCDVASEHHHYGCTAMQLLRSSHFPRGFDGPNENLSHCSLIFCLWL